MLRISQPRNLRQREVVMRTAVFIEDSFDAAHWLPNVPLDHKCHRMHGHTYRIRMEVAGKVDPALGWIIDYSDLKEAWEPVKERLDHRALNDILANPTCELIAGYIANCIPMLSRIELRETVNCGVVWERNP